jgi:hypothetical protein
MQRTVDVPAAWVRVIEALVILSVLAIERGARRAPRLAASGAGAA